jgi:hypothetical protein
MSIHRFGRVLILVTLAALAPAGRADDSAVQVLNAGPEHPPIAAEIGKLTWLVGRWKGSGLGATAEEVWLDPVAGTISGTFRLSKPDGAVFYEIMTLGTKDGVTAMRLKHFHPSLEGWEERTDVQQFPLLRIEDDRYYFEGMTLVHRGDALDIHLEIENRKAGTSRIEIFRYQRIGGRLD